MTKREIMGEWVAASPEYLDGLRRWAEYYVTTDEFDAQLCTASCPATGDPVPATPEQRDLSVKFANAARKRLRLTGETPGQTEALRLSTLGLRRLLAELTREDPTP
jgi:hypothetical protein